MDNFDALWNVREDAEELRKRLDRVMDGFFGIEPNYRDGKETLLQVFTKLAGENFELKLRLSLLVRLLIKNNLIIAEEYAALIAEAQPCRPSKRYFITDPEDTPHEGG